MKLERSRYLTSAFIWWPLAVSSGTKRAGSIVHVTSSALFRATNGPGTCGGRRSVGGSLRSTTDYTSRYSKTSVVQHVFTTHPLWLPAPRIHNVVVDVPPRDHVGHGQDHFGVKSLALSRDVGNLAGVIRYSDVSWNPVDNNS